MKFLHEAAPLSMLATAIFAVTTFAILTGASLAVELVSHELRTVGSAPPFGIYVAGENLHARSVCDLCPAGRPMRLHLPRR